MCKKTKQNKNFCFILGVINNNSIVKVQEKSEVSYRVSYGEHGKSYRT